MSTDTTLAPCPWCGAVPDAALDVRGTAIECPSCGTRGLAGRDAVEAVAAWQMRAPGYGPRKPLTDEQIDGLAVDSDELPNSHLEFARAIEAAHGIKP